ncbi:uncharacterized protein TrAtP1_000575 [Trichoderma atroviride]|uniref:uncharacterized protein n=1 Tax=Hypocrea atroviridis TaxID=63577 RepID=UPI0033186E1D|nr:hypothetical protein TrAtP1_000575 [Trichoderma atroviride]
MDKPPRTTNTQVREWNEAIKDWTDQSTPSDGYPPQHPAFLWKVCWEQLNTIKIPLYSAELFFDKALKIAKDEDVTNSEEFMRRFKELVERDQDRWEDSFETILTCLGRQIFYRDLETRYVPPQEAWKSVHNVCDDRSYWNFLQLLRGVTVGWRSDSTFQSEGSNTLNQQPYYSLAQNLHSYSIDEYHPYNPVKQKLYSCGPYKNDLYNGYNGHDYGCDMPPPGVAMLIGERYQRKRKRVRHDYNGHGFYMLPDGSTYNKYHSVELDFDTHSDGEPTQLGERSQSKREKKVGFDGIPDDDNKQRSKRQKLERSTADSSSSEHVQGETAAGTSDDQMSESHTTDPPLSHASSSFTQPIKEERPAKRSKRQRQEVPTADSPSSLTAFSSSENTEERPAKRVRRQMPENDTAGSSLPHASSSHTERVEEERPAKRIKREMPENDNAGSLLPHASSSRTERVEEEILAGRLERQGREFATAGSSLSPIPSPNRSARGGNQETEAPKARACHCRFFAICCPTSY